MRKTVGYSGLETCCINADKTHEGQKNDSTEEDERIALIRDLLHPGGAGNFGFDVLFLRLTHEIPVIVTCSGHRLLSYLLLATRDAVAESICVKTMFLTEDCSMRYSGVICFAIAAVRTIFLSS